METRGKSIELILPDNRVGLAQAYGLIKGAINFHEALEQGVDLEAPPKLGMAPICS